MDCPHKPQCPSDVTTWNCGQRSRVERAMFNLELDREAGERLLRMHGLPIKPMSATERYKREERDKVKRGPLFA